MGIADIRVILYVITVTCSGILFMYTVVAGGLTWIKAANSGVLRFQKSFSKCYYYICYVIVIASLVFSLANFSESYHCKQVIADGQTIGAQAFQDYEADTSVIENEEVYISGKMTEYMRLAKRRQQNGFFYLFMSMFWVSMMILNTGFITQEGYYPMCAQKPQRMFVRLEEDILCFYAISQKEKLDKPVLQIKNTKENRSYFAPVLKNLPESRKMEAAAYAQK